MATPSPAVSVLSSSVPAEVHPAMPRSDEGATGRRLRRQADRAAKPALNERKTNADRAANLNPSMGMKYLALRS